MAERTTWDCSSQYCVITYMSGWRTCCTLCSFGLVRILVNLSSSDILQAVVAERRASCSEQNYGGVGRNFQSISGGSFRGWWRAWLLAALLLDWL